MVCVLRSDDSDGEIDDVDISKILIVTQTPPSFRKHPQGDRTGDFTPRSKMTAELAKVINDGLCYYEADLWEDADQVLIPLNIETTKYFDNFVMENHKKK